MKRTKKSQPRPLGHPLPPLGTCGPNHLDGVRWKQHKSIDGIMRAFFAPLRPEHIEEAAQWRQGIEASGYWAFAADPAKRRFAKGNRQHRTIHFWHDGKQDALALAFLLAHEAGHLSGKPLRSRRNAWREEQRADHYGHVVATVLTALKRAGIRP